MLSNFLGVKPEQNLRDLAYPVSSFRKLREQLGMDFGAMSLDLIDKLRSLTRLVLHSSS